MRMEIDIDRLTVTMCSRQDSVDSPEWRDSWDRFIRSRPPWEQKMLLGCRAAR
jgi:hypothetical protein